LERGGMEAPASVGLGDGTGVGVFAVAAGTATTVVAFRPLAPADLDAYLASGEWEGKAGAYAIQGSAALFADGITGDYANVVGLPLSLVGDLFRRQGFDLLRRTWLCSRSAHKV
jgi:predicted house-cleaning NTP pyrophosphatase (Maf/HAM1 superfamily)